MPNLHVDRLLETMATGLQPFLSRNPLMIGIHTGGAWIAESLHRSLGLNEPQVKASNLPTDVNNRHVVLVDDVLHTGRTTRAAMNVIFDYGRPSSIVLAVLVERNGRELPIQPDVVGKSLRLAAEQHVKLSGPESLSLKITEKRS